MYMKTINIIGAGLAGCEAANYLLKKGYSVNLFEMKPIKFSEAHKNENFAELVCSNSLKGTEPTTAGGVLKNELSMLGSLLLEVANEVRVPSGSSLSVDRDKFSEVVTKRLKSYENLTVISEIVKEIDFDIPTIVATGPLTDSSLANFITQHFGGDLYFYDAIAPILDADTIDYESAYFANRYDKGDTKDFINLPMNKEEYLEFYNALISAESAPIKEFDNLKVYEGCMPIEVLAKRGQDAMRYGPLKPVGLDNPRTGRYDYAVVQLRKESLLTSAYNMVGVQTNLKYGEQKRVFSLIPALKDVQFLRYGAMHRNSYINAPQIINQHFQCKTYPNLFFAGQISGVEGYIESMASGLVAAINMDRFLQNKPLVTFPTTTIIGGLANYVANYSDKNFQPMGSNMGLLNPLEVKIKNKKEKNAKLFEISQKAMEEIINKFSR